MNLTNLFTTVIQTLNSLIPVIAALGLVYFVWGVVQYFIADAEEAKKTGKDRIIYGIIGFAIISGLWGLVNILISTFKIGGSAPRVASAGLCGDKIWDNFAGLANYVVCIIGSSVIPFMFAVAVVVFVWGVVKFFIINADEEAKRSQGKQFILWGLIAITVMVCVWGLVRIVADTFSIRFETPKAATKAE